VFRGKRAVVRHAPDGGPDEVERFVCRRVMVGAHPGDVLPDVHHLEKIRIEPPFLGGHAERMLMEEGRAGGDDDPVELVLADVGDDEFLARVGTHVLVVAGDDHVRERPGETGDLRDIHGTRDIVPAVTDVKSDAGGVVAVGLRHGRVPPFPVVPRASGG